MFQAYSDWCDYYQNHKKLRYCRRTARCTMLVNSCSVSRGTGIRKVSNSKSDLQWHSLVLATVPFYRPHTISYCCSIATMSLSCTVNEILSLISQNLKRSVTWHSTRPFWGSISCMRQQSCVSIIKRNLKCIASPFPQISLGQNFKKRPFR